jgi:hypothetical protein
MRISCGLHVVCLAVAVVLAVSCPAEGQNEVPYQSESGSWSFIKPNDWNPIGFAVMREVEAETRADYPDKNYKYIAGFTRGGMNTFNYPYMFVNVTDADLSGLSYADLERGLSISKPKGKREEMLAHAVRQFAWGETVVESDRNRTVSTVHLPPRNRFSGGTVTLKVYSYLGAHNIVQFEVFDLDANGSKNDAAVNSLVGSFRFSEGNAFVPTAGVSNGSSGSMGRVGAIVLLAIIGGVVVLAVTIKLIAGAMSKG